MRLQLKSIFLVLAVTLAAARPNPEAQPEYRSTSGRQLIYYPIASAPVGPPVFFYPSTTSEKREGDDLESTEINPPPEGASVAEAQPIGIAIAGLGGVAVAQPIGTAVVGPNGLAIARPIGTAIAGVPGLVPQGASLPIGEPEVTLYLTGPVLPPPQFF